MGKKERQQMGRFADRLHALHVKADCAAWFIDAVYRAVSKSNQ
jgi:hypothetical protein